MRIDLENIHEMCVSRKKVFVDYAEFYHLPSTHTYVFLHMCAGVYVCGMITSFLAYSGEKDYRRTSRTVNFGKWVWEGRMWKGISLFYIYICIA